MHRTRALAALAWLGLAGPALAAQGQIGSLDQPEGSPARINDPSAGFEQAQPADARTGDSSEGNASGVQRSGAVAPCSEGNLSGSMDDRDVPQQAGPERVVKPITGVSNPGPDK